MTTRKPRRLDIPAHWTTAQANAVLEFLALLVDEVFLAYEEPLCRLAQREALGLPDHDLAEMNHPSEFDDDPIPF